MTKKQQKSNTKKEESMSSSVHQNIISKY